MTAVTIKIDVDGVLADYEGAYRRLFDADPAEKGKVKAIRFKSQPHFYRHLPLMPDAMHLWNFVKEYHPKILSAQSNYVPASRQDKLEWVEQHFHLTGQDVIIVDYPNQKYKYCTPGAILIDDNPTNCAEWDKAGGHAILHKNAQDTIYKLKVFLQHVETKNVNEAFEQLASKEIPCVNVSETFDDLLDRT